MPGQRAEGILAWCRWTTGSSPFRLRFSALSNRFVEQETLEQRLARLRARKKALKEESKATQKALKVAKQKKQRLDSLQHGVVGFALKVQGFCGA